MKNGELHSLHLELDEVMALKDLLSRYQKYKDAKYDGFSENQFNSFTMIRLQLQGLIKFLDVKIEVVSDG